MVSVHMSTLCHNPKSTAVKVTSSGTLFSGKFALMAYFIQESTVVYPSTFDIADHLAEEVKELSAPRTSGRQ